MASEAGEAEQDEGVDEEGSIIASNGKAEGENEDQEEEEGSEDEEDEEPRLKYASLTKHLKSVYRNGDATNAFLIAGDKMIIGTHNGNIHVVSVPSLKPIRVYHAHTASVSGLSISPFPPPLATTKLDAVNRVASEHRKSSRPSTPKKNNASPSPRTPQHQPVPLTPSNMIYIASSSIDGNVCVASLTDPKDVQLRNFGRPLHTVSLSPDYRVDRSYLSGGMAGNLVLTVGGRSGTSSTSTTTGGAAASASGWLGAIGLGGNTGRDQILHSGEGAISTIKWSLSGKHIAWVNEQGIKIMRSNLHLESGQSELGWKRISHTDHPNRPGWDEMAGIWKAHVEWIDEAGLESDDGYSTTNGSVEKPRDSPDLERLRGPQKSRRVEKLVVGWSGTIWIINVHPGGAGVGAGVGESKIGRAEVVTILRIDCIISGISLYTPNLLLVLAYITPEEDSSNPTETKPGRHRRQNALQPEMRIIDITTKEEVSVADTLNMSRFESLSATDYHLGVLPAMRIFSKATAQKGALEAIGGGIEAIGGGIWDATMYPARLFSSSVSVRSGESPASSVKAGSDTDTKGNLISAQIAEMPNPATLAHGMKIFIHSPYDCVIATKPSLFDHLSWLDEHALYEDAWKFLDRNPEAINDQSDRASDSTSSTPTKTQGSLIDFFADDSSQTTIPGQRNMNSKAEKEKRRIGDQWIQQLISKGDWSRAGRICGQVVNASSSWEHWVLVFAQANKYEEITPFIPTSQLQPPLPSLVYELMLGHYIQTDRLRLRELLEIWPSELFDPGVVVEAIESKLKAGDVREDSNEDGEIGRDWRILLDGLAKLYLANGQPRKALSCYIRLQDADASMSLIAEYHLVSAVSDNIPGFILLRVSKAQQKSAPLSELATATLEPIRLLVAEAHHGIVQPETVIQQLEKRYGMPNPYLFFYFRALWTGNIAQDTEETAAPKAATEERLLALEGKTLVSDHADTAVHLFAEYDRPLLMEFLKSSQSYDLARASKLCENRDFIPELVYLLSKEGRTTKALRLIIDSLNDVSQAISFAKEQNDASLWDDLLDYSMNKPRFIRGLLEEVGTSIDPLKLVKRIPLGLEIEGLREGLGRMLRDYEVHESISEGVARVLRGEVNAAMQQRGRGQRMGVRFDVAKRHHDAPSNHHDAQKSKNSPKKIRPGYCLGCGEMFTEHEKSLLLAFPCTHTFHLPCLLKYTSTTSSPPPDLLSNLHLDLGLNTNDSEPEQGEEAEGEEIFNYDRSIGPKIDRAALLSRTVVRDGCPVAEHRMEMDEDVG